MINTKRIAGLSSILVSGVMAAFAICFLAGCASYVHTRPVVVVQNGTNSVVAEEKFKVTFWAKTAKASAIKTTLADSPTTGYKHTIGIGAVEGQESTTLQDLLTAAYNLGLQSAVKAK